MGPKLVQKTGLEMTVRIFATSAQYTTAALGTGAEFATKTGLEMFAINFAIQLH